MEIVVAGVGNPLSAIPYHILIGGKMFVFEELVNVASFIDQEPGGLGESNKITLNYGVVGDANSPIQLLDDPGSGTGGGPGTIIRINEASGYVFEFLTAFGRMGGAGVSELLFRFLVDDVQVGTTTTMKIDSADIRLTLAFPFHAEFPADADLRVEMLRASGSNNDGGALAETNTDGWAASSSVALRVGRWIDPL